MSELKTGNCRGLPKFFRDGGRVGNSHLTPKETGPAKYTIDEEGKLEDPPLIVLHFNIGAILVSFSGVWK